MKMADKANYNKAVANGIRAQFMKSTTSRFLPLFCHHLAGYLGKSLHLLEPWFFIYKRETDRGKMVAR